MRKDVKMCQLLLNHPDFNCITLQRSHEGCTALFVAIFANLPYEIVECLVKAKPALLGIRNNEEVAPLHEAAKNRRLDLIQLMVEHGANVNDLDLDLENILHLAASNTDYQLIQYLLRKTEVDTRATNRDDMNPLCLLLVRSRHENREIVDRCFHMLLEQTYDKNYLTNTYEIGDIFKCAFLACVYAQMEIARYLIHNIYSVNNSKYAFIRKLTEYCDGFNNEYLYYILVFLHDAIDQYDKFSFPRFHEINYYMSIRSVIQMMETLLPVEEAVECILGVFHHMEITGFEIRVKEFEDQIGVLLHELYSGVVVKAEDLEKLDKIFAHLHEKKFRVNPMVCSFLHSIAISKDAEDFNLESAKKIIQILIRYATTFFFDYVIWREISEFKGLNTRIAQIIDWLVNSCGNMRLASLLDFNVLYSLKHTARNEIRQQLCHDADALCNPEKLASTGLPQVLLDYVVFKE